MAESPAIDPATIDDDAYYVVTVVRPGRWRLAEFVPGTRPRVKGRVLRDILGLIAEAQKVED